MYCTIANIVFPDSTIRSVRVRSRAVKTRGVTKKLRTEIKRLLQKKIKKGSMKNNEI